jgi:hypothetical protein
VQIIINACAVLALEWLRAKQAQVTSTSARKTPVCAANNGGVAYYDVSIKKADTVGALSLTGTFAEPRACLKSYHWRYCYLQLTSTNDH